MKYNSDLSVTLPTPDLGPTPGTTSAWDQTPDLGPNPDMGLNPDMGRKGRTLGAFIKDDIAGPLGVPLFCGMPVEEQEKYGNTAEMRQIPMAFNVAFNVRTPRRAFSKFV